MKKTVLKASVVTALVVSTILPTAVNADASAAYTLKKGKLIQVKTGKTAKGYVVYQHKLYKNGKVNKGYALVGKGSTMKLYYNASLKKGYKQAKHNEYLFKDGALVKGYKQAQSNQFLYKNGQLVKGYKVYTTQGGTTYLYQNGQLKKGLKTATYNKETVLFNNGKIAKGHVVFNKKLYTNGKLNKALTQVGNVFYNNGFLATGMIDGDRYENGVIVETAEEIEINAAKQAFVEQEKEVKQAQAEYDELLALEALLAGEQPQEKAATLKVKALEEEVTPEEPQKVEETPTSSNNNNSAPQYNTTPTLSAFDKAKNQVQSTLNKMVFSKNTGDFEEGDTIKVGDVTYTVNNNPEFIESPNFYIEPYQAVNAFEEFTLAKEMLAQATTVEDVNAVSEKISEVNDYLEQAGTNKQKNKLEVEVNNLRNIEIVSDTTNKDTLKSLVLTMLDEQLTSKGLFVTLNYMNVDDEGKQIKIEITLKETPAENQISYTDSLEWNLITTQEADAAYDAAKEDLSTLVQRVNYLDATEDTVFKIDDSAYGVEENTAAAAELKDKRYITPAMNEELKKSYDKATNLLDNSTATTKDLLASYQDLASNISWVTQAFTNYYTEALRIQGMGLENLAIFVPDFDENNIIEAMKSASQTKLDDDTTIAIQEINGTENNENEYNVQYVLTSGDYSYEGYTTMQVFNGTEQEAVKQQLTVLQDLIKEFSIDGNSLTFQGVTYKILAEDLEPKEQDGPDLYLRYGYLENLQTNIDKVEKALTENNVTYEEVQALKSTFDIIAFSASKGTNKQLKEISDAQGLLMNAPLSIATGQTTTSLAEIWKEMAEELLKETNIKISDVSVSRYDIDRNYMQVGYTLTNGETVERTDSMHIQLNMIESN